MALISSVLDMLSVRFQVTHVTSPSMTYQHHDIRSPHQIILQELLLFSAKSSAPPQSTLLADPKVGGQVSLAVVPNLAGAPRSQIVTRSMTIVYCGDATCSGDIFLKQSRNGNHGMEKILRGEM
jgi:hypothetical protein